MPRPSFLSVALFWLGVAVAAPLPAVAADASDAPPSPTLDRIKRTGTINLAYREGAPPFSFKTRDGRILGYSVDLCTHVAASIKNELGLPELKVNWMPVNAANRIATVATGAADAVCGTTTVTLARMASVDFSVPIFVDGGTVLVKSAAKLVALADLKGHRIAVIGGTTTERALKRALDLFSAPATLVTVKDGPAGMALLARGTVDGVAGDRTVLDGLRLAAANPGEIQIMAQDFSMEKYAIVVPRNDADFRLAVNKALVHVYRSGEIDPIFQRWFGGLGEPGPLLHAMFYLNTLPE